MPVKMQSFAQNESPLRVENCKTCRRGKNVEGQELGNETKHLYFKISHDDFNQTPSQIVENIKIYVKHVIEVCRYVFSKFKVGEPIPTVISYRL
jgi:hypothetical protein